MIPFSQQIANLTPEQRALLTKRLAERGVARSPLQPIPRRLGDDNIPLSFAQQRLWFIAQLDPDSCSYNVTAAFRLRGELQVAVLEYALNAIVARHETLRTIFRLNEAKQPVQVILPEKNFSLQVIEAGQAEIQSLAEAEFQRPFDLALPLLRLKLLRLDAADHVLLLSTHHIICDRTSVGIFVSEMMQLYTKQQPLDALPIQYADWAIWQRQRLQDAELDQQINYWRQQLANLSVLDLPTDRPRPPLPSSEGEHYPVSLSTALSQRLKALSSQEGVTLFTLLLTALAILLYRYTGQNDVVIGTEMTNRDRPETNTLIGLFVNTLVLRLDLSGSLTFRELLKKVRNVTLAAFEHADVPFEKLVEVLNPQRNPSQMIPLFQVKFDWQLAPVKPLLLPGLDLERLPFDSGAVKYELRFNLQEREAEINGQVEYRNDLFDKATIAAMVEHWQLLLEAIAANPEQMISELPLGGQTRDYNTQRDYPQELCIHQLFAMQAQKTPEAIAVSAGKGTLTYGELNSRANQLAHYLQERGIGPEGRVGICCDRSLSLIVGLLGILKAGAAYVPLDVNYPQERLSLILEDAQVSVLLTTSGRNLGVPQTIDLETDWPNIAPYPQYNPNSHVTPGNLAYLIYTSGSTGKPKGVAIEHRSTVQFLHWTREVFSPEELTGVLAATSICFDLAIFEIFVPLSWGGSLILVENVLAISGDQPVTLINTVPSALAQLLLTDNIPPSVRTINLAGEPLSRQLVQQLNPTIAKIYNLYGPSEDTTYSTYAQVTPDSVTIGQPIANTQVYILDSRLQPVPWGVPGELYLSGSGLARGYLNRPDLTAERFIPNPNGGGRLYKTGDRVRCRQDGNLEFLGRWDDQVKIRGYRVEIAEIEEVLREYPQMAEVTVIATADRQSLVAYIVLSEKSPLVSLRSFLAARLPSYMIPGVIVELDTLPRLPNGKIDRQGLPKPQTSSLERESEYVAPTTALEKTLVHIWQEALQREKIGIHDNFFALGGHSLLGMEVSAKMADVLGIAVPLRSLFHNPTIARLSAELAQGDSSTQTAFEPLVPDREQKNQPFPLTEIQQAYLMGRSDAFALGNVATHGYREIETSGLTVEQVEQALGILIERHDMLRMIVLEGTQQQILSQVPPYTIETVDLRGQNPETTLAQIRERLSHRIPKTEQWPLFEIVAALLDTHRIRFHLSFDVLIGDAWSFQILAAELLQLLANPSFTFPPLTLSFRDYVLAELSLRETPLYQNSLAYWQEQLSVLPPAPELPLAKKPEAIAQPRFVRYSSTLAPSLWQRLKENASEMGITPSALTLAAFAEILALWSSQKSFTINLTLFNRLPLHPEVGQIIGDFTSSTLLAVHHQPLSTFSDRAQAIQAQLWADLDHRYVSGVKVLRELARLRGRSGEALMPVVFTSTLTQTLPLPSSVTTEVVYSISQTSQVYLDHQVAEVGGTLVFNWDAVEEIFPPGVLAAMFNAYGDLLNRLAQDFGDTSPRLLANPPNTSNEDFPAQDCLLHHLFLEQARLHPDHLAILTSEGSMTYQELRDRSLSLARHLQALGVIPNQLVAVVMEKGWEQVVAVLAILASGAAYVPIDASLPEERRSYLLQQTQAQPILTQSRLENTLTWPEHIQRIWVDRFTCTACLELTVATTSEDLAYVIYTSGSTGLPKGVMIEHRGAVNTILDINQRFNVTCQDRVLALSSLSFDLSVYDIFGVLGVGGALVIPDADKLTEPSHWRDLLLAKGVTLWNSVPAFMEMLLAEPLSPNALRLVLLSGDWIPLDLPQRLRDYCGDIAIVSLGGATEASIWSIFYPITTILPTWQSIPYGFPLSHQSCYVLNDRLQLCPQWVTGDIYIAGRGLARGYWQDTEKTAASFIFHPDTQERLYKTGDLGRYLADGSIEFLGRADSQVKLHGYRLELGEIEAALKQHRGVNNAIVTLDNEQLIAYILPDKTLDSLDLKLQQPRMQISVTKPRIQLTKPDFDESVTQAFLRRQSFRKYLDKPISRHQFSNFLSHLLPLTFPESPLPKYRYASAGSLYPVQVYLLIKPERLEGIEPGFYYYYPLEHELVLINDYREVNGELYGSNKTIFQEAAFALFLIGELDMIASVYNEKARDLCLLEAGYIGQLLMENATQEELGICPIGALDFAEIGSLFELKTSQILLHSFLGGRIDSAWTNQWIQKEKTTSLSQEVRQFLLQKLPDYMIPSVYRVINALPLNSNGKIDRKLLPKYIDLPRNAYSEFIAPSTDVERAIAAIWQHFLKLERMGIHDNFFDLGGNSFLAAQILARIHQSFEIELTVRHFFENPTIVELSTFIEENSSPRSTLDTIERVNREILDNITEMSEEEVDALLIQLSEQNNYEK